MARAGKKQQGRPKDAALTARRQEEILEAAVKVFAKHGFANTDLQLIADALGVAKGTLYRYFPSKKKLFLASVEQGVNAIEAQVESAVNSAPDPLDKVAAAITSYFRYMDDHPELLELLIQERAEFRDLRSKPSYFEHCEGNKDYWRQLFRNLIDSGQMRNIPVDRIVDTMGQMVYGTLFTNYFAGKTTPLVAQVPDILDVLFNGVLTKSQGAGNTAVPRAQGTFSGAISHGN